MDLSILCDPAVATAAGLLCVQLTLAFGALSAFRSLRRAASRCRSAQEQADFAKRALRTQSRCHARDSDRLTEHIAESDAQAHRTAGAIRDCRQLLRDRAASIAELQAVNDDLVQRFAQLADDVCELEFVLQDRSATCDSETVQIEAARLAAEQRAAALKCEIAEDRWRTERDVALAAMRADEAIACATTTLRARAANIDAGSDDASSESSSDLSVTEEVLASVELQSRYDRLSMTHATIDAEVRRVWNECIPQLHDRIRGNSAALEMLNREFDDVQQRDEALGTCVEAQRLVGAMRSEQQPSPSLASHAR